jgi:glycosyl transferase family 25
MLSSSWHCTVINLDRSPQRLKRISERLETLAIPFVRFAAIDGLGLDPDATPQFSRRAYERKHGKSPTPCEIGCFLSHVGALQGFLESGKAFGLILEDDAIPESDTANVLSGLARLAGEWDVALLYGNHSGTPQTLARLDEKRTLVGFLSRQTGAVAYAVNRRAAKAYVRELLPMTLPIDVDFDRAWDLGIRFRGVMPFPVKTGAHPSDIGTIGAKFTWHRRLVTHALRFRGELKRYRHYAFHDPIWLYAWRNRQDLQSR